MSRISGQGLEQDTVSPATGSSWQKPAAADDIVDPIGGNLDPIVPESTGLGASASGRDQSLEEEEDVPLDVKLTDALSMLADGGHDYGSRPVIDEELDDVTSVDGEEIDLGDIDESSKDA